MVSSIRLTVAVPVDILVDGDITETVMINLSAVPNFKPIPIHKSMICSESDFFRRALSSTSQFIEAQDGIVTLSDTDDVASLRMAISYIYRGKSSLHSFLQKTTDPARIHPRQLELAKLYVLADSLLMHNLKNDVIDEFHRISSTVDMNLEVLNVLLTNDLEDTKLTQYVIADVSDTIEDAEMYNGDSSWSQALRALLDKHERLSRLLLDASHKVALNRNRCRYHEHGPGIKSCDRQR